MARLVAVCAAAVVISGCQERSGSSEPAIRFGALDGWPDGAELERFGSLHEVMMEGATEGRVNLGHFLGGQNMHGVGAMAVLDGEVTYDDGVLWISRVRDGQVVTERFRPGDPVALSATLLGASRVSDWQAFSLDETSLSELASVIRARADRFPPERPVPFRVVGRFVHLSYHVIDGTRLAPGASSHAAHKEAAYRGRVEHQDGVLVGFMGETLEGLLTHRGESIHAHVTLESPNPVTGHVDDVRIAKGAKLLLPAR